MEIVRASKKKAKARIALYGPSGSGKTYTALNIAQYLGQKVFVLDTENLSASKYADIFTFDTHDEPLPDFAPKNYIDAIGEVGKLGYDVMVIDSLSHAWSGKGGALEMVDAAQRGEKNQFAAWRHVTPWQHKLVEAILSAPMHIIATMRSKTEYAVEGGKVQKLGLAPIQRDGVEYEFDVVGDMDQANTLHISKSRCADISGKNFQLPGKELADRIRKWLEGGEDAKPVKPKPATKPANGEPFSAEKVLKAFQNVGAILPQVEEAVGKPMIDWTAEDKPFLSTLYAEWAAKYKAAQAEMEAAGVGA